MSDKTYNKPPWIKTGRRTRAMRSAKKQKNMELREKRRSEEGNTPVQEPMEFGEMANWRPMDGTPGLKRQRAENFNAYSDPISDRQVYKIKKLGGKVDSTMNRSQASDYIKDLMGVPSGTWKAEYISDLSNGIVQFEDGYGILLRFRTTQRHSLRSRESGFRSDLLDRRGREHR